MAQPINSSNLPTNQEFKFENYPGAEQWFAQFLNSLNLFTTSIYQILNGGVTYQNLTIPQVVLLGNVSVNGQPSSHPSSASCVYWHFSQGSIYIDNIPNLTASTTYVITLVVL